MDNFRLLFLLVWTLCVKVRRNFFSLTPAEPFPMVTLQPWLAYRVPDQINVNDTSKYKKKLYASVFPYDIVPCECYFHR